MENGFGECSLCGNFPCDCPGNPLEVQVAGTHYKNYEIQPITFCMKNHLNACQTNVIKYICRYNQKGQAYEDLAKAKHYIDLLIELENIKPNGSAREE